MRGKPLRMVLDANGCVCPSSHRLNKDGYFRKKLPRHGPVMYHRATWEACRGPIPEGYEIDHMCKNRACSNINHLQCIPGDVHAVESNQTRYASRKAEAKSYWEATNCSGTALANKFGVTLSAACGWIRGWKV